MDAKIIGKGFALTLTWYFVVCQIVYHFDKSWWPFSFHWSLPFTSNIITIIPTFKTYSNYYFHSLSIFLSIVIFFVPLSRSFPNFTPLSHLTICFLPLCTIPHPLLPYLSAPNHPTGLSKRLLVPLNYLDCFSILARITSPKPLQSTMIG